jgi:hypothetical protein
MDEVYVDEENVLRKIITKSRVGKYVHGQADSNEPPTTKRSRIESMMMVQYG